MGTSKRADGIEELAARFRVDEPEWWLVHGGRRPFASVEEERRIRDQARLSVEAVANHANRNGLDAETTKPLRKYARAIKGTEVTVTPAVEPNNLKELRGEAWDCVASIVEMLTGKQNGRTQPERTAKAIDEEGCKVLRIAWDEQDPAHRKRPTWPELANAVHKALGLSSKVESVEQALKQRCPETRKKWDAIGREMQRERDRHRRRLQQR